MTVVNAVTAQNDRGNRTGENLLQMEDPLMAPNASQFRDNRTGLSPVEKAVSLYLVG